jgi:hypothetical protein
MKNLKLFALGLLGFSMVLTSCSDDEDDAPNPVITVEEALSGADQGSVTVTPNETVQLAWNARKEGTGAELETFAISSQGVNSINPIPTSNNGNTFPYSIANADDDQYIDYIEFNAGANLGTTTWSFTVTDKDGKSATASFAVEVANASTPLGNETMGAFFHIGGSLQGAYDLVSGAVVAAAGADSDKDMRNTDMAGAAFTGSWEAGNATEYVKDNSYDYANATEEGAMAAYSAGSATTSVSNPAANDIYIAKLRGGSDYAVIRITDVDPTNNDCNCGNTGKIEFDFKKK